MAKPFDIEKKYETDSKVYWAVGPIVHVLEMPGYPDHRRFLCLSDIKNDCKHVEAVKRYLGVKEQEAAA